LIRNVLRGFTVHRTDGIIMITMQQTEFKKFADEIEDTLRKLVRNPQPESVTKNGDNTMVTYRFNGLTEYSMASIRSTVSEGFPLVDFKLYFHRPGTI
jgi:hypothetical protein